MNRWRALITLFVVILLAVVALGWLWTSANQPPEAAVASRLVLGLAGLSGLAALVRLWTYDPRRT